MKHWALMNLFYATAGFFLLNEPFYATDYLFYQWNLMIAAPYFFFFFFFFFFAFNVNFFKVC